MPLTGLRARVDDGNGVPRYVFPLLDLTARSDEQLERTRVRRIIAIGCWFLLFVVGLIGAMNLESRPLLEVFALAAIVGGVINTGLSIGGLVRVLSERRARDAMRRAFAEHPEPSKWDER